MAEEKDTVLYEPLTRRRPCGYANETATYHFVLSLSAVIILCLLGGLILSYHQNYIDHKNWRAQQVKFVGVMPDGALVTLDARMFTFPLTDKTLRHALDNFVRLHFERVQVRVRDDYASSLIFLDKGLQATRKNADTINVKAVMEGQAEEVRIDVLNTTLRNIHSGCEKVPCEATIIVKKTTGRGTAVRTTESTIELQFVLKPDEVTPAILDAGNPMGLTITDVHEYEYLHPDALGEANKVPVVSQ